MTSSIILKNPSDLKRYNGRLTALIVLMLDAAKSYRSSMFAALPIVHPCCRRVRGCSIWMYPEHMVEIYKLLGGGTRDAGVDGSLRPTPNQLAIIPGTTHYDLMLKATQSATGYAKTFLANRPH